MEDLSARAIGLVQRGDLDGARALFQFILDQRTAMFGNQSPSIIIDLANLANVLAELHDVAAARELLERAVALRVQQRGPDHPDVATELGNLGLVLEESDDFAAAHGVYERALGIQIAAYGPKGHPSIGVTLANLAGLLRRHGQLEQACRAFELANRVFERHYPPSHPARLAAYESWRRLVEACNRCPA